MELKCISVVLLGPVLVNYLITDVRLWYRYVWNLADCSKKIKYYKLNSVLKMQHQLSHHRGKPGFNLSLW